MSRDSGCKFFFSPNSVFNFRNVTKFEGNWLKNKKVTGKKQNPEWNPPPPQCLLGLILLARGILQDSCLQHSCYLPYYPKMIIPRNVLTQVSVDTCKSMLLFDYCNFLELCQNEGGLW